MLPIFARPFCVLQQCVATMLLHRMHVDTVVFALVMCDSCWAMSSVQAVESALFLNLSEVGSRGRRVPYGKHYRKQTPAITALSVQQHIDCDVGGFDLGCSGGDTVTSYQSMMSQGILGRYLVSRCTTRMFCLRTCVLTDRYCFCVTGIVALLHCTNAGVHMRMRV